MYQCYFRDFHHSQRLDRLMQARIGHTVDRYLPGKNSSHVIARVHAVRQGSDLRVPLYMMEVEIRSQFFQKTLFLRKKGENIERILSEVCHKLGRIVNKAIRRTKKAHGRIRHTGH